MVVNSDDEALEAGWKDLHQRACCPPLLRQRRTRVLAGGEEGSRRCCSRWEFKEFAVPIAIIYRPNREDESAMGYRASFTQGLIKSASG